MRSGGFDPICNCRQSTGLPKIRNSILSLTFIFVGFLYGFLLSFGFLFVFVGLLLSSPRQGPFTNQDQNRVMLIFSRRRRMPLSRAHVNLESMMTNTSDSNMSRNGTSWLQKWRSLCTFFLLPVICAATVLSRFFLDAKKFWIQATLHVYPLTIVDSNLNSGVL